MNILKQDSGLIDKFKINPNTDSAITAKTKSAQTEELAQIKNFDDMYERTPVWATPSSSRPIFLGQGADPLYKDAITRGADAGLIARAKDKFWYGLGTDKPLPKLVDANLTKEGTRQYISRNVALRNFALKQINKIPAFGENTRLGKMLKDKGWMNPKFEPLNQEVYTSGFAGRSKLDKLVAQRDELQRKVLSADGTLEDKKLLKQVEKDIAKTEKETLFSESDQWFKLVKEDGQYVVATKKTKSGIDEVINTTDEYNKLIERRNKLEKGRGEISALRTQKSTIGEATDKTIDALILDASNIKKGYQSQISALESQKNSLKNLAKGIKTKQVFTKSGLVSEQGNPYAGLMAQLGGTKIPKIPKSQSTQSVGSIQTRITKLKKQAKDFLDPYDQKLKNLNAEKKELEKIISSGKYSTKKFDGKIVQYSADATKIAEAKSKLRGVKADITRFTNEIKTNKGYQDTLKEIESLKRQSNKINPAKTKTVKVQASPSEISQAQTQIANIDASIAKLKNAMNTDPKKLSIDDQIKNLIPKSTKRFESKISSAKSKYQDETLEADFKKFQKENVKLGKESNTYAFNRDAENLPQIKFPDPIGKRKSKQSLNDALKDETSINNELKEEIERFIKDQKKFNRENPKWTPDEPKSNKGLLTDFKFFKNKPENTQFENIIGSFRENSTIPDGIIDKAYGAPLGIPSAFAQGTTNVQSQPTKTVQPQNTIPTIQPRIGTTNLFRPNTSFENISKETAKVIPKIGTTTDLTIKTENIQRSRADTRTDVMQSTAQAVKQVGDTTQELGQQFKQIQQYAFKATEINPPKLTTAPLKPKIPVRKPVIIPTPTFPTIPPFFGSGSKRKKKKKKTSKDKKKLAVWAVPDVWFDAKGYYFQDGQAYLTGASAKKALRKSKKR